MSDWIIDRLPFVGVAFLLLLVAVIVVAVIDDGKKMDRLMRQCMDDGKKEYECYALLHKSNGGTAVVPMVVPVGR